MKSAADLKNFQNQYSVIDCYMMDDIINSMMASNLVLNSSILIRRHLLSYVLLPLAQRPTTYQFVNRIFQRNSMMSFHRFHPGHTVADLLESPHALL